MTATAEERVARAARRARLRRALRFLGSYALVLGVLWAARSQWGIEESNDHGYSPEDDFRIHVVNRSQTPVLVDAFDGENQRRSTFLIDRERGFVDVSAPVGGKVRVSVRPLTANGPGARPGLIEWNTVPGTNLNVVVDASGHQVRSLKESNRPDYSMISVRSEHDLPIRVGWDMAPGNGGIYMPDARDRESNSWVGTGVHSWTGGMEFPAGQLASLPYAIPAVRKNARDFEIEANADGEIEVSIGRDGVVDAHEMTLFPTLLKFLRF